MRGIFAGVFGGLALLILGGCTNLATIENVRAGGKTFHDYLYMEYRDLALFEGHEMYDMADSEYFAAKARMAFGGGYVEPTLLNERDLPPQALQSLEKERFALMQALQGRVGNPDSWKNLAAAQAAFDCRVEETEENRQPDRIEACRARFDRAMAALGGFSTESCASGKTGGPGVGRR